MGIVWISMPAHDQSNRFKMVASLGTVGTVFRVRRRLPKTTTFRFLYRKMPAFSGTLYSYKNPTNPTFSA
jgi:hypothetical protein